MSPMSMSTPQKDSDSCDTLPPARVPSLPPPISFPPRWPSGSSSPGPHLSHPPSVLSQPNSRKLCVRHQRIADEGINLKLQQVRLLSSFFSTLFSSSLPVVAIHPALLLVLTTSSSSHRLSTTSHSKNANPLMQYGLTSHPHHIPAENLFCGASLPCAASLSSLF